MRVADGAVSQGGGGGGWALVLSTAEMQPGTGQHGSCWWL